MRISFHLVIFPGVGLLVLMLEQFSVVGEICLLTFRVVALVSISTYYGLKYFFLYAGYSH